MDAIKISGILPFFQAFTSFAAWRSHQDILFHSTLDATRLIRPERMGFTVRSGKSQDGSGGLSHRRASMKIIRCGIKQMEVFK